jgi:hypothetical protein
MAVPTDKKQHIPPAQTAQKNVLALSVSNGNSAEIILVLPLDVY